MALKYFNIRTGETRLADTEPKISALWGSSDRGPNAHKGQDFGWRLAPEVKAELLDILGDESRRERIAIRYKLPLDGIGEKEILRYISDKTSPRDAPVATPEDFADQYEQEVRRLRAPKPQDNGETTVRPKQGRK